MIQKDIIAVVQHTRRLSPAINTTSVTLIPKVKTPTKVKDYRHVAYCTTLYNIISKVLTRRMKLVIAGLVGKAQSTFVEGRSITDNIMVNHEFFKSYNRKWISPRCVLKVDLREAYGTLDWGFLEKLLKELGFPINLSIGSWYVCLKYHINCC